MTKSGNTPENVEESQEYFDALVDATKLALGPVIRGKYVPAVVQALLVCTAQLVQVASSHDAEWFATTAREAFEECAEAEAAARAGRAPS